MREQDLRESHFVPIILEESFEQCFSFRRDSFVCSFGSDPSLWPHSLDATIYRKWLKQKISKDPASALHLWFHDQIIGQLELGRMKEDPSIGYLHFCYLIPSFRGTGVSKKLIEWAEAFFLERGHGEARLSVSPQNLRAYSFYKKVGWKDQGPRPNRPEVLFMGKSLG
ncbi:MAG: GNAT family N-acetyltransferase [Bdellovibrionales bacterium]|nr:GNAT family N-acetyltransferase [Bdellovibrionales bacterium]